MQECVTRGSGQRGGTRVQTGFGSRGTPRRQDRRDRPDGPAMNFPARPLSPAIGTGQPPLSAPDAASLTLDVGHAPPLDPVAVRMAKLLQRWRRERRRVFCEADFVNPVWDIWLNLFLGAADGRRLTVKAACLAATVSKTTGLRYLRRLHQLGLVTRSPHPTDHRSAHIELTDEGLRRMQVYLGGLVG